MNAWINDLQLALLPCSLLTAMLMITPYPSQVDRTVYLQYSYDGMKYRYDVASVFLLTHGTIFNTERSKEL